VQFPFAVFDRVIIKVFLSERQLSSGFHSLCVVVSAITSACNDFFRETRGPQNGLWDVKQL